jgi:hypothetical protein
MKKFLLTAVIAMLGMSAWAAKPEAGTKGYLYNAAAGKFIGADAKLSDTGQEFEIYFKSADSKNPNEEFPDRGFGENSFFVRFKTGSNYLAISSQPVAISANYSQMVVKETENGWLISHAYVLNDGNAPDWVKNNTDEYQGAYLQVVDGELVFSKDETNKAAYWQFVDEDTYKKIAGPTYPIDLTGDAAKVAVTVNEGVPTFTPTASIQNVFQIKNFDVSEFRGYGYKKIVVEFSGAAEGQFHAFAYGTGQDPNWDIVTGMDNAPEWLAIGDSKYEVALVADVIDDFTVFTWFGSLVPLTIDACYFSKEELGAEKEPTPEPEPIAFPETGAKGYIYNPAINMFIDATGALATEGAIFAVYRKDSDTASDIRFGVPGDEANKHLRINGDNPVLQTTDPYYSKWGFEAAEGGLFLLKAGYDYGDPKWCTKGYYLTATQDGAFEFVETATEASYWQFVTEEEIATRIASVSVKTVQKGIYNVAGQQLKNLQKGLNIVNGKKIMVK